MSWTAPAEFSCGGPNRCPRKIARSCRAWRRVVLSDSGGMLADQIERRGRRDVAIPAFVPMRGRKAEPFLKPEAAAARADFRRTVWAASRRDGASM